MAKPIPLRAYCFRKDVRPDYVQGVLTITLPKKELAKARASKVNICLAGGAGTGK
jgi:HSP20 family molecular chaperone IbpA